MWTALLWTTLAGAQEDPPPLEPQDDAPIVIEVLSTPDEALADLSTRLRAMGYLRPKRRGDQLVFLHRTPWRSAVHLYADGRFDITRGPIRFNLLGAGRADVGIMSACLGPALTTEDGRVLVPPVGCASLDGLLVSKRRHVGESARLLNDIRPEISAWSRAVSTFAWNERLEVSMPAEIRARIDAEADLEAGYQAAVDWACSRTSTPEGDAARGVAADVLGEVFPERHPGGDVDWDELCGWGEEGPPW
jgi:hypothetical protein